MKHKPSKSPDGGLLQGGMPKDISERGFSTHGIHVRAVVVATYVYDEPEGASVVGATGESRAVYCDCVAIGPKYNGMPIPRALVAQDGNAIHEGKLWIPRPATNDAAGKDISVNKSRATNLSNTDGSHVLVTFMDDDFGLPVILKALPHPIADAGNENRALGHRLRPKRADGLAAVLEKRNGGWWKVDADGNWTIDLTRAHKGVYDDGLKEPAPALDGASGNFTIRIPEASKLTLELTKGAKEGDGSDNDAESTTLVIENNRVTVVNEGGVGFESTNKDADAEFKIGDGAMHATIVEHLEAMWRAFMEEKLRTWNIDGAAGSNFVTAVGPAFQVKQLPEEPWDSAINSSKVSLPDG